MIVWKSLWNGDSILYIGVSDCCLMPNWATFQLLVRKDMDANEHERLSNITHRHKFKVKEQFVVRKDMNVNEHERLSNITHRHKLK